MKGQYELGPIRPPSEAYSLLIRATRNCSWNRCRFCDTYRGKKFELRPVADIKEDIDTAKAIYDEIRELAGKSGRGSAIDEVAAMVYNSPPNDSYRNVALWMYAGGTSAFLQDANTLIMRTDDLEEVLKYLKATFPSIERVTSYARSQTAAKKTVAELTRLHEAGLSRLHIGLETGYDPLLKFTEKGATAAHHVEGGKRVVASGISLSEYVLLGLGGKSMWREHALETARVLNEINPDYIRFRTMVLKPGMPMYDEDLPGGKWELATDEEVVTELKLLIENLNCSSNVVSDHIDNLLQEVEGKLPQDKEKMLAIINRFQSMPLAERTNFRVGRRVGIYTCLDDIKDPRKRSAVDGVVSRIRKNDDGIDEDKLYEFMQRFV
ncbi:MAG: radical SAM protein [Dehalococcoidales bacterium]|nr:radical SAM protein [Dehalococcoidales bacterium]